MNYWRNAVMLTRTSQYALQALIHLVRHSACEPVSSKQIARLTHIPQRYLSTVLGELAQAGVLESTRGKGGGFRLAEPAHQITLYEIVAPFESTFRADRSCPFGNATCGDDNPCLAHSEWKQMIEAEQQFLQRRTLYDVSVEQRKDSLSESERGANYGPPAVL